MAIPQPPDSTAGPAAAATPRTAQEMLRLAREFLARRGIEEARLEAELLVAHALGLDRLRLFLALDRPITPAEVDRARDLLVRRGKREPTAYIIGKKEFYGRPFQVGRGVLVPRPETELLVDRARELARAHARPRIADLGTGSGCLALTLALEIEQATVTAVELSPAALLCARANLEALLPAEQRARVVLLEGDGFELLRAAAPFEILVANPPYVGRDEAATLAPEVRDYEPGEALFAPAGDPDHFARRVLDELAVWLAPGGTALIELGHRQAARVRELARARGLTPRLHKDLAGIERVLEVARA